MMRISLIILLITGLFACNQSAQEQKGGDTLRGGPVDTAAVDKTLVDTMDNKIIRNDTSTGKPVSTARLITPGKGIGHLTINDDAVHALKVLGKPDSADAAMGSQLNVWFAGHNPKGYRTSVFSRRGMGDKDESVSRIQKILVTSPWFQTTDHFGVGTTIEAIKKVYSLRPTAAYNSNGKKVQVYTDMDKGISFEVDDATQKCVGIVVHKAHDDAGAYINMH